MIFLEADGGIVLRQQPGEVCLLFSVFGKNINTENGSARYRDGKKKETPPGIWEKIQGVIGTFKGKIVELLEDFRKNLRGF